MAVKLRHDRRSEVRRDTEDYLSEMTRIGEERALILANISHDPEALMPCGTLAKYCGASCVKCLPR